MKKTCILFLLLTVTVSAFCQGFESWAQTPPLGWNSWDCFGPTVVEDEVKANADYMAANLKDAGWEYIVIDIRWYIENDKAHGYNEKDAVFVMDEYGRLQPSPVRFPSSANGKGFKAIGDYIHSKGLKFGIHIMRGIPKEAVKKNTMVLGTNVKAADIYNTDRLCKWLGDMYTVDYQKPGAQEYYNSLFNLYASWGLDFVKVDDLSVPYHKEEIEMIRKAIDQTGRPIVLSTSPGETPLEDASHVMKNANMWRTVGDFWDSWAQLKEHFDVCNRWSPYIGNGHFPDADMLPLGRIGIRAENGDDRMTRFTKDEQYTLMTLFSIFRSPLMYGGDLPSMDPFTLSLLTNKDVLEVNKFSSNNKQLFRDKDLIGWIADDAITGDKFVALFNAQDQGAVEENKAVSKSAVLSIKSGLKSTEISADITNAQKLFLYVSDAGDGNNWDHADWVEPKLTGPKGELKLTELKWVKARSGWSSVMLNRSVGKNSLNLSGKEYANGIGTHSNSLIEYTLPEGYTKFSAKVGLDNESVEQPEGASIQFFVFTENPAGEMPADSVTISVKAEQLGFKGDMTVKNLWTGRNLGVFKNEFAPFVRRHGAGFYRISAQKK